VGGRPVPDGVLGPARSGGDPLDELAPGELVEQALALDPDDEQDDDRYWEIVAALQRRGDLETFEAARALCRGASDDARCLGAAVLAQLGPDEEHPFLEESLPLVLALCGDQASEDVLAVAVRALGWLGDPRGAAAVLSHRRHPEVTVRFAVAESADAVAGDPPAAAVVDALVDLARDEDEDVRDRAAFGLLRLLDADEDLAAPRFIPALATLREREEDPDMRDRLTDAIARCATGS
jgi:HEAT repeat protein